MAEHSILPLMSAAKICLIAIAAVTVAVFTVMSVIADFPLVDAMWAAGAVAQLSRPAGM